MQYTKAKENERVAHGYAQASAGAPAPAHAQHTNARRYTVAITTRANFRTAPRYWRTERIENAHPLALVRIIALKHAKGYKFDHIFRTDSGTYIITLSKQTRLETFPKSCAPQVGKIHDCPIRDALRLTREGTQ